MTEAKKERNSILRSMLITAIVTVVLLVGATIGWYALASKIETILDGELTRQQANGNQINCEEKSIRGYPFRVGPWCETTRYENLNTGLKIEAGQLRTAAQFYNPGFAISELDGPAYLTNPRGDKAVVNWQLMRASTRAGLSGIKRLSIEMKQGSWTNGEDALTTSPAFSWNNAQFHGRPSGGDTNSPDLEAAFSLDALKLGNNPASNLPVLSIESDTVLKGVYASLLKGRNIAYQMRAEGLELEIRHFTARFEDGGVIKVSGPIAIDRDGLLSGKAQFEIAELEKIADSLEKFSPKLKNTADTLRSIENMLGQSDNEGVLKLPIAINRGEMKMGFIPLGTLPPVF